MSEDEQDELSAAMKNPYRYYRYYFREHFHFFTFLFCIFFRARVCWPLLCLCYPFLYF